MPLPIPSDYAKNLIRKWEMARKGILPPTFKMIIKKYCPLPDRPPARQSPVHLQHPEILSCSQSPMPCTEPESLGDDQTDSASLGAQADGRNEEQLETSLVVQPDDMTGKHRDGEKNPLKRAQFSEEEGKVVPKCECLALKSPSACEGMNGPGEPHSVTQQTTVADGISHPDQGGFFCF